MTLNKRKGSMFRLVTHTWNPIIGCLHGCTYCWARAFAKKRLKHLARYSEGFKPKLIETELREPFNVRNAIIFVTDMGDMWGRWVPGEWILKVIEAVRKADESNMFLFQSKNPARYHEFLDELPRNVILGTTIETNRDYHVSKAPCSKDRFEAMVSLPPHKFVSIEPIMDFDLGVLRNWIEKINPAAIEVGADNYGHNLIEPEWDKVDRLIRSLRESGYRVIEKANLYRLKRKA